MSGVKYSMIMLETSKKEPAIATKEFTSKELGKLLFDDSTGGAVGVTYHHKKDRWVFRVEVKDTTKQRRPAEPVKSKE